MNCPKCQFENLEEARFCRNCGNRLDIVCPECSSTIPRDSKFCQECGHNLKDKPESSPKDLSFEEKIAKIQRYLPEGLTQKILSQRDRIEGERKQVTVMFCDLEGFTALTERLGPEEAYAIMDQVYEILIHKVHDYEGTVNEMTGDGIVALFGAPIALEGAPHRAVRSAMEIHREMVAFSDKMRKERRDIPSLRMRIGIHTGPVVVGTLGNDLRVEFKAVGDTVNLASRMEEIAEPGATYITGATFKLTVGLFRCEALGARKIKGKEEPVNVYQVIGPSGRRTRFDVTAEGGLTSFVGREREIEILLDGFEGCKAGRGQAFSIVAEAGLGKSRLLYEFRKAVSNEDVTFLEGRCVSYSKGVAYHPFLDTVKSNFDIQEGDEDSTIRAKVQQGLKILGVDEGSTLPYLLELLSLEDSGIEKISMSREARKDRMVEALRRIILRNCEIRPLIMAFEDIHWLDNSSQEGLKSLLESVPRARVLAIFTYRPEFVYPWGARSFHNQINLNRLSNRETLAMAASLLRTEKIDRDLEELILEKTDGVPFFVEEFVKSLKDLRIIEKKANSYCLVKEIHEVAIPSTIQDVIMARVDSLPNAAKEVLQTASIIEREFSYELIERVTGMPEKELFTCLSRLKDSELIYERGVYPETNYVFKHALTQEVLSESILTNRKKRLHEKIGNAIEELHRDSIHEHYGILSEHFIESGNYEKGSKYSKLARKKAEKMASLNDAIAYGEKTVACLERLNRTEAVEKQIIDARTSLALYYTQTSYNTRAREAVTPIVELAEKYAYKRKLAQIYGILGSYDAHVEENSSEAYKHFEEALRIAEEVKDVASLVFGNYWFGMAACFNCEFEKTLHHLEKALHINSAVNSLWGISTAKSFISYLVYYFEGKFRQEYQFSDEAVQIAEESGDIFSKAWAYTAHGISCYANGTLGTARDILLKGVEFCEKINLFLCEGIARQYLGDTLYEMGEYQGSEGHYDKAAALLEAYRVLPSSMRLYKAGSIRAGIKNGKKDIELVLLRGYVDGCKLKLWQGRIRRYVAEVLFHLKGEELSVAESWIKEAMEADKGNGMRSDLGHDYALYAELFRHRGIHSRRRENLEKALHIYRECGADGWVKKVEKALAGLP